MAKVPHINQLMSMAQDFTQKMEEKLNALRVVGNAGGGMVTVTVDGHKRVLSLTVAREVVDPADVEMLQDLILAAIHDAQAKVEEQLKSDTASLTAGLPGGFPFGAI